MRKVEGMSIRCSRCGRPLKDAESVERGMGEQCAIKAGIFVKQTKSVVAKTLPVSSKQLFLFEVKRENLGIDSGDESAGIPGFVCCT